MQLIAINRLTAQIDMYVCVCVCVCVCLYMHNKYIQNTHTTFILYAINRD